MKKTQIWSPDTCRCKFEVEWDTDDPPSADWTFKKVLRRCSDHDTLPFTNELLDQVHNKENRVKNRALAALEVRGVAIDDVGWSFEGKGKDRRVRVGTQGRLSTAAKAAVQSELDLAHGKGKAVIE